MSTEVSNIDDLLTESMSSSMPSTPESSYEEHEDETDLSHEEPETQYEEDSNEPEDKRTLKEESNDEEKKEPEYDDYGNTKAPPRTYTQEEVNEMFRMRNKNKSPQEQEYLKQQMNLENESKNFEYNPESEESWETQLENFVEKTISKINQKDAQKRQMAQDEARQSEFEDKFTQGMNRFNDFREVVGSQPITDPMTHALRGLSDPAAFIYAASKRHPQELARISQLQDPISQIVEMGKLEERMKKGAQSSKAPRPVSKSRDDAGMPTQQKKKEPTIEDLIARSDAKRKQQLNQRRGNR